ncbi:LITAF-like zinc ribbon domain-containing protein [Ditylenchus destructor]|uniref:LITAF-like zinc ribbon domain-containing protein n=1 Tax=Ditylenchus destructor TaxID=166010 RepID=A0AAD4RB12_9BILA|nr:LITAF-like zinc ribbon domain-containing protein [Ditylenchus destructor]
MPTVVVAAPPVVVVGAPLSPDPVLIRCPSCHAQVFSSVQRRAGGFAWMMCILLAVFVTPLCCCIPFCIDDCQDAHHHCPNCGAYLGRHRACLD